MSKINNTPGGRLEIHDKLSESEQSAIKRLADFVPEEFFDIHAQLFRDSDFDEANRPACSRANLVCGSEDLRRAWQCLLPGREVRALCFPWPGRGIDARAASQWVSAEVARQPGWFHLALASPGESAADLEKSLGVPGCAGLKVCHSMTGREDSMDCAIEDYAPEWMWELLDARKGILMLPLVRDRAIADPVNQQSLGHLCRRYPRCRVILAHIAGSFSHRHALEGLESLREIDNVLLDTSAVCESQAFAAALDILGPERVLFGSDYPVSHLRGRCVTTGQAFHWIHDDRDNPANVALNRRLALVGMESLLALREASESCGLDATDIRNLFRCNAERLLGVEPDPQGLKWNEVKSRISCGTGLMSKRREQFDQVSWPTFYSRCRGACVWDLQGKRYTDFAGGVGAILLGYADPDIERAVRRRLSAGTYCTLVSPDEDRLARQLIDCHPWAARVRFARGGGEAMAVAVRIARAATGRSGVAFCGYHGWQDWYLAANLADKAELDGHLLPGLDPLGVPRELRGTSAAFMYNDISSLEAAIARLNGAPAAVVMEPMRSKLPEEDFLRKVAAVAQKHGAVFVIDEITSGFRYGFPGAHKRLGVEPDIAVYAKAMSNGFPCAAIVGNAAVMDAANPSFISSSYWTDGVGAAAASACLRKIQNQQVSENIWSRGLTFAARLREVAAAHPGCGLTIGGMPPSPSLVFDVGEDAAAARTLMVRNMVARGFLVSSQLYLMNAHTERQIEDFLGALNDTLAEVADAMSRDTLQRETGAVSKNHFARLA